MQHFEYRPLGTLQVRLVCLSPGISQEQGIENAPLKCSIKTFSLSEIPPYTALSYTWGCPDRIFHLLVSESANDSSESIETILSITKSVEEALLHLRHPSLTLNLWIDQLCINQDDIVEKSTQVLLMKAIYEKASHVLVWLGPAVDGSDYLIDLLTEVGQEAFKVQILEPDITTPERKQRFEASYKELTKPDRRGSDFNIPLESLRCFVDRAWWTRVWVVQELLVADLVTFVCGTRQISYQDLRNALYFYPFFTIKLLQELQSLTPSMKTIQGMGLVERYHAIMALGGAPTNSAAMKILTSRHYYQNQIASGGGQDLYRILVNSHVVDESKSRLGATDDRDKIYGILGLAKDADELGIVPNYKNTTSEVYTETAKALLLSGHVDFLWFCQFPKSIQGLPTWVPDWSKNATIKTPHGGNFSRDSKLFAASGALETSRIPQNQSATLIALQGVFVGTVEVIGSPWVEIPNKEFFFASCHFVQEIEQFCVEAVAKHARLEKNIYEEGAWRIPIGDKEWNKAGTADRATSLSRDVHTEALKRLSSTKEILQVRSLSQEEQLRASFPIESKPGLSYSNFLKSNYNRRPFRTTNGYVGLGPLSMLPSDEVRIFLGAQVPYLLRQCNTKDKPSWYQFLG